MKKIYISANELTSDSFKFAEKIYKSGFRPNIVVGLLRGGIPISIAIQEYLAYLDAPTDHYAIHCSSYESIGKQRDAVDLDGLDPLLKKVKPGDRLLIVDDVFESGRSMQAVLSQIEDQLRLNSCGPIDTKVATLWFKPTRNVTDIEPDYYLHETGQWLVFPHELQGLTLTEISENKTDLVDILQNQLRQD